MNKKLLTKKTILIFTLFIVMLSSIVLFFSFNGKQVSASVELNGWVENITVMKGESLDIPDETKIIVDGDEISIEEVHIIYPDGTVREYDEYTFTSLGDYQIKFVGKKDNTTYSVTKPFFVTENTFNYAGKTTSAEYREISELTEEVYSVTKGKVLGDKATLLKAKGYDEGILDVYIQNTDTFTFNKVVDLYSLADADGIVDVCSFLPANYNTPQEGDASDTTIESTWFIIKMVDAYDPSNYIEFCTISADNRYYFSAGAANQKIKALCPINAPQGKTLREFVLDGQLYLERINPRYNSNYVNGAYSGNSLIGRQGVWSTDIKNFPSFSINPYTWQVYYDSYEKSGFLNDLDSSIVHEDPSERFKGFTTGEVYLQFKCEAATESLLYAEIASIFNFTGAELDNSFVEDTIAPTIRFDLGYTNGDTIYIKQGQTFELPKATIIDLNTDGSYKTVVYKNYNSAKPIICDCINNEIAFDEPGRYTVEYVAEDYFGNSKVNIISVVVIDGDAFVFTKDDVTKLEAAIDNRIPVLSFTSYSKYATQTIKAISPSGKTYDITATSDGEYCTLFPEELGEWTIEYTFNDKLNEQIYSYKVQCTNDENRFFTTKELAVPTNFIRNAYYDIDNYYVSIPTATGAEQILAEVWYSINGADFAKIQDQHKFKIEVADANFNADGENTISFKTKYGETFSEVITSRIIDLNYASNKKQYEKYFYGYDSVESSYDNITYKFDGKQKTERLAFVTPIAFRAFNVEFGMVESEKNFDRLNIVIKALGSHTEGYRISYREITNTGYKIVVEDLLGNEYAKVDALGGFIAEPHSIQIADGVLRSSESVNVELPEINSRNVEFYFEMEGVNGECGIIIKKVCNQSINGNLASIFEAPAELIYPRDKDSHYLNETYKLPKFNVSCAFHPTTFRDLKITFKTASGEIVNTTDNTSLNQVVLDYFADSYFVIDNSDRYLARFSFSIFGTEKQIDGVFTIKAVDTVKPEVSFVGVKEGYADIVAKDTKYTFRDYVAKDETTATEDLYIVYTIYESNGNYMYFGDINQFIFRNEGIYKIQIYCRDAQMNYSTAEYYVSVK